MTTLEEAKDTLRAQLMAGEAVRCPCCTQTAKIYKRSMTSVTVRTLWLVSRSTDWQNLGTLLQHRYPSGGQATLSHYWELMEKGEERGVWRITQKGLDWVNGAIQVPKYAVIYSERLLRWEGDLVRPQDVADDWFDYADLMSR
jgi:hypothetical protein